MGKHKHGKHRGAADRLPVAGSRAGSRAGTPADAAVDSRPMVAGAAAAKGGRLSVDTAYSFWGAPHVVLPPTAADEQWRFLALDNETLRRISPARLMELLADLSPDVSRALWDFLRLCNPGWTVTVTKPGGDNPAVDARGQAAVDAFLTRLADLYGAVDVVWGRLFMAAFLRGAMMAELVLDLDGRMMADLATPDPATVRFIRGEDPVRGVVWQLAQWQNRPAPVAETVAGYVPLDWPTIRYVPIDPFPGVPYGRAMAAPALFSTLFLLGLLHDLRRVVAQQGYPRLDLALSMEKLAASMPPSVRSDPAKYKTWVNDTVSEVEDMYRRLQPDDAFVHTDVVSVNRPVGTVDASSLGAVDGLIAALERMSTRALKTMPFMAGLLQGSTETQAIREYEQMCLSIRATQHYAENMLSRLLALGLRAQGMVCDVAFRFAEIRASEEIRDATGVSLRIANAFNQYSYGWISQDEAAQAIAGHDADAPAPRILPRGASETSDASAPQMAAESEGGNGDPSGSRLRVLRGSRSVLLSAKPSNADIDRVRSAYEDWAS